MLNFRILLPGILAGLLLGLGVWSVAEAYILPARFYLQKYAKERASFRQLKVKQMTTYFSSGSKRKVDEVVYIQCPGNVRVEQYQNGALNQVHVHAGKTSLHWRKNKKVSRKPRRTLPLFDLFAVEPSGYGFGNIRSVLRRLRVFYRGALPETKESDYREQTKVGLTWFSGHPVVMLGALKRGQKRNQLWLDKNRFVPLRFLGQQKKNGPVWDIRFLAYNQMAGKPVFPSRIEVYVNGKLRSRSLVYKIKVGSLPAKIFNRIR